MCLGPSAQIQLSAIHLQYPKTLAGRPQQVESIGPIWRRDRDKRVRSWVTGTMDKPCTCRRIQAREKPLAGSDYFDYQSRVARHQHLTALTEAKTQRYHQESSLPFKIGPPQVTRVLDSRSRSKRSEVSCGRCFVRIFGHMFDLILRVLSIGEA